MVNNMTNINCLLDPHCKIQTKILTEALWSRWSTQMVANLDVKQEKQLILVIISRSTFILKVSDVVLFEFFLKVFTVITVILWTSNSVPQQVD